MEQKLAIVEKFEYLLKSGNIYKKQSVIQLTQLSASIPLVLSFRQAKRVRNLNADITTQRFQASWNDI